MNVYENINGEKYGYNLCEQCYAELFGAFNSAVSGDILAELLDSAPKKRARVCPVCGMDYSEFERTGLLGCPSCYDVFNEQLLTYIERIQGKTVHVGKVNQNAREQDITRLLFSLREKFESAVRERRYADAERINEKISDLCKLLDGKGGDKND